LLTCFVAKTIQILLYPFCVFIYTKQNTILNFQGNNKKIIENQTQETSQRLGPPHLRDPQSGRYDIESDAMKVRIIYLYSFLLLFQNVKGNEMPTHIGQIAEGGEHILERANQKGTN
jgi:hypothetical protein